MEECSKIMKIY